MGMPGGGMKGIPGGIIILDVGLSLLCGLRI
jgi:hypothetical protein